MSVLMELAGKYTLVFWSISIAVILVIILGVAACFRETRSSRGFRFICVVTIPAGLIMCVSPIFSTAPVLTRYPLIAFGGGIIFFIAIFSLIAVNETRKTLRE